MGIRRLILAGFPRPVERVGNSLWHLEFSTLSSGASFHGVLRFFGRRDARYASLPPRFLRIDSPCISMRWALCGPAGPGVLTASVGSPIWACHFASEQKAGQDEGANLVAVFANLQEVAASWRA